MLLHKREVRCKIGAWYPAAIYSLHNLLIVNIVFPAKSLIQVPGKKAADVIGEKAFAKPGTGSLVSKHITPSSSLQGDCISVINTRI